MSRSYPFWQAAKACNMIRVSASSCVDFGGLTSVPWDDTAPVSCTNPSDVMSSPFSIMSLALRIRSSLRKLARSALLSGWSMKCFHLWVVGTSLFPMFLRIGLLRAQALLVRVPDLIEVFLYLSKVTSTCVHVVLNWLKTADENASARSPNVFAPAGFPIAWTSAWPPMIVLCTRGTEMAEDSWWECFCQISKCFCSSWFSDCLN